MFFKVGNAVVCIGSSVLFISSQKVQAKELIACHDCNMKRLPKAKELPIYETKDNLTVEYDEKLSLPLVSQVSHVHKQFSQYTSYVNVFQERAVHIYETGVAHSKSTFEYLKDEENKVPRIMLIASGAILGFLYARKGGIFKKVFYPTLGTGVLFSAFYPGVSKEYILSGWNVTKSHVDDMLIKYGGYDTNKWAEETKAKLDNIKSAMKFEGLTNKMKEMFYKDSTKAENSTDLANKESLKDKDMYTTRT